MNGDSPLPDCSSDDAMDRLVRLLARAAAAEYHRSLVERDSVVADEDMETDD